MLKKMKGKLWLLLFPCAFALMIPMLAGEKKSDVTPQKDKGGDQALAANSSSASTGSVDMATSNKTNDKKQLTREELFSDKNVKKLSEAYGHFAQKSLETPFFKFDFDAVVKGMQDSKSGKPAPMTDQEFEEMFGQIQEFAYQDLAARNLQEADKFLKENAKKDGVKELEPGKLQYMILQEGSGEAITDNVRPVIKHVGQYIDGTVFSSSDSSGAIPISLKQTIQGFHEGVLGMKVGEKRRIFIHPDLGYGMSGQLLPNSLLIFDIEVVDVKPEQKDVSQNGEQGDEDGMQLAAENLFPDELDEYDDFDDEYGDEDDDEDEGSTSEFTAYDDEELEQNDFQHMRNREQQELKRVEQAKAKANAQSSREAKLQQEQNGQAAAVVQSKK